MKVSKKLRNNRLFSPATAMLLLVVVAALWGFIAIAYADGSPTAPYTLDVGYLDFAYGPDIETDHTGSRPESKVWWNDGYWWATMWNDDLDEYHIYQLDWGSQVWQDTGIALDDRVESRTDVHWDESSQKLYIASHFAKDNPSRVNDPINWARLYRFSYDEAADSYVLDAGFPNTEINQDKSITVVIDQESSGRMWATYVSRPQGPTAEYQVYVNASDSDGETWEEPFSLYDIFPEARVSHDDISSVVAFNNTVGVMWTNQISGTLHFALHNSASDYDTGWTHTTVPITGQIDDHLSLKASSTGQLFAAIKTTTITSGEPLIALVARDNAGVWSFHQYSAAEDNDTRPVALVDEDNNQVYVFVTGKPGGSMVCYKTAAITTPLSNMSFAPGDCGTEFIADDVYDTVDSATTSKHVVTDETGLVVLASDDPSGRVYVHNVIGDPPPVITQRSPAPGEISVAPDGVVAVTFSKAMDPATVTGSNFTVEDSSGLIAGSLSYDGSTRTATFTPATPLSAATVYTVTVTTGVEDESGTPLFETEEWSFTTGAPLVAFSADSYSVLETEATATITLTLSSPASGSESIDYATSDGTATAGSDYTASSGTVNFANGTTSASFTVPIADDATDEANETVSLTLSNPMNVGLGVPVTSTLSIVDDEGAPTLQFQPSSVTVNENAGTATVTVGLSPTSGSTVTVDYATSAGSATAGADYTETTGTLTFNPGDATKTFTVPIIDDTTTEPNETVNMALSNPTGGAVLGVPGDTGTLTITDNDGQVNVAFSAATYNAGEGDGTATITVNLNAASSDTVSVNYATAPGSATSGTDYTPTGGTLTFSPGETSKTFNVAILNDALNEPNETVNLTLSSPTNAVLGTPSSAALTITDDDLMPTVQFSVSNFSVNETAGTATVTVELSGPSGQTTAVDYATSNGSATAGSDYTAVSGTLDFAAGETSKTFEVAIVDDGVAEGNETISLTLSNPDDVTLGTPSTATLTIMEGDYMLYLPVIFKP